MGRAIRKRAVRALAAAAIGACGICVAAAAAPAVATYAAPLPPIDAATSLLVVAPHPDDETLCCAGIMQRVVQAGGRTSVVWLTSGDAERLGLWLFEGAFFGSPARARQLGEQRMAEARAATAVLGLREGGQLFLGYPDGGLAGLLGANRAAAYTSRSTGAAAVPYSDTLFPGHPYSGESLERDFAAVLERTRPTLIPAPSPRDEHPDHRAAGLLTIAVSERRGELPRVRYWIVHGGEGWPSPRELMPGVPLTAAPLAGALAPTTFALTPAEEDRKLQALRTYATQMREMAPFLLAFVRTDELFYPLAGPRVPAAPALLHSASVCTNRAAAGGASDRAAGRAPRR
jgi:LmbE family N-acetylglucosaminyl deacetylase